MIGLGLALPPQQAGTKGGKVDAAFDLKLYRDVLRRMRAGEPYEHAAVEAQRAGHYPLRPFVVVRPPALALALVRLPSERTGDILLAMLAVTVVVAWAIRLHALWPGPLWSLMSVFALLTGVGATMFGAGASLFHEAWAGLLMALSLALRTERRFAAAVALGLVAGLIRELAIPYSLVMAVVASSERRWKEATAFAAAAALALAALAWHAEALRGLITPADPASQGWVRLGGWPFILATSGWNLAPLLFGRWVAAFVAPLALIGAMGWKGAAGVRLAALLIGYTLGFLVIGRPENAYWGLMVAPLAAVGLCLAPTAVLDLLRRSRGFSPATA